MTFVYLKKNGGLLVEKVAVIVLRVVYAWVLLLCLGITQVVCVEKNGSLLAEKLAFTVWPFAFPRLCSSMLVSCL